MVPGTSRSTETTPGHLPREESDVACGQSAWSKLGLDWTSDFENRSEFRFSSFEKRAGSFIGNCSLFRFDWTVPRGEIGYWCATNRVGHGYITEAVLALAKFAWSLGLVRVEIRCDAKNLRSRAVAERAGFALEGVLKNDCRNPQGALRDSCLFAQVARSVEMTS
jgi:ribosomal-protein-serine acetyltransferase